MNTVTHSDEAALRRFDLEIENAREAANAEEAWTVANGSEAPNPWENSKCRLDELFSGRNQLQLRVRGEALTKAHNELRRLDEELSKAQVERELANRAVQQRSEDEIVKRYLEATSICMRMGWGHSWSAFFRPWYESNKPRYQGLNESGAFFVDSPLAKSAGVRFDLGEDREAVKRYMEAQDAANKAQTHWCALAELRANLLRERPELHSASKG